MSAEVFNPDFAMPAGRRLQRPRAPVPLEPLIARLKQVSAVGSNIFALIRRVMLLILQRVAKLFNVKLEHNGLEDDTGAPEAAYTGDPDFRDDVTAASKAATSELSALVQEILKPGAEGPAAKLAALTAKGGAPAFLSLCLDDLARAMAATTTEIQHQDEEVDAMLAEVAARTKVQPESLRSLLATAQAEPSLTLPEDPGMAALSALIGRLEESKQRLVQLQLAFCDHCIAARQVDGEGDLGSIAKCKAAEFGDPSLCGAIEMALVNGHTGKENAPKMHENSDESNLNSGTVAEEILEAKETQAAAPSKRGFRARSYFVGSVEGEASQGDELFGEGHVEQQRARER